MNRHRRRRRAAIATPPPDGRKRAALPLAAAAGILLLLAGAFVREFDDATPEPIGGGHWSLVDAAGAPVTDRDLRGRYVLLYFGYTGCPDLCPTTLNAVADALHRLGGRAGRLQPVFVTVDPGHDTPSVMGAYVRQFDPRLVGLTGTAGQVATIEREYGIRSRTMPTMSVRGTPAIDHTAVLLLLGPDGRTVLPLAPDETGPEIARRIARYVS